MKLLTVAIPCYNSQGYMSHAIETALVGGDDIEIIIIDDGSTDETPQIADEYARKYPDIVRVIHQKNAGHGGAVNTGISHAKGKYFKVLDSDDWFDEDSFLTALGVIRNITYAGKKVDMLLTNYVYEKVHLHKSKVIRYTNVLPVNKVFRWNDVGRFLPSQNILMHSVTYRTTLLRECGLKLPEHTFYVDNLFAYVPLPYVRTIFYLPVDMYRYYIGRADQSVNEAVMIGRIDQQIAVNKQMIDEVHPDDLSSEGLTRYMAKYLGMICMVTSSLLIKEGRRMEYPKERERGYEFTEDLYVPGYFEVSMKKGDVVVFSGGISEASPLRLRQLFQHEYDVRTPRDSFWSSLVVAAHQFHNIQGDKHYVLAGYPWFKCRARDMFISLPGLTLSTNEPDEFHSAMQTATQALEDFMEKRPSDCKIYEIEQPDVLLWAMWTLQQYARYTSLEECWERYGALLTHIMDYLRHSKHPNLFLHENGLVYSDGRDRAVTWMNSTVDGKPVVPRSGYIVEFNALWYNALRFSASVYQAVGEKERASKLDRLAQQCGSSFTRVFLNEYGYLFDYVDGDYAELSVRPNMVFASALEYSPLTMAQRKSVLDLATRELLTPRGLRSLSPKSLGYNPVYQGVQTVRDYAYHQGTAWPWLEGFYMEAYLKIYKRSGVSFVERQMVGFEEEMATHCIGTICEMFDGNPPYRGRGAIAFAVNVAEILRTFALLKEYK